MELAFAGLQQFCAPMLDRLERLPGPQRDALGVAFGLTCGACAGSLSGRAGGARALLSEAADERPLVCVVDDAQWLDRASAQALAFVARRLLAESVAMVFAVREPSEDGPQRTAGATSSRALDDADARALLASVIRGPLDERVGERIVAETRGNPLALLELPRGLAPAELAGGFGLPDAPPLSGADRGELPAAAAAAPDETQRLLLVAAAEPVGEPMLLWRAAERLGLGVRGRARRRGRRAARARRACAVSTSAGALGRLRGGVAGDRQSVHRALAEATDAEVDPDRRAWHRAQAALGPDEDVAEELERSAGRAQARGGLAAAAAFLERAAALTPSRPAARSARWPPRRPSTRPARSTRRWPCWPPRRPGRLTSSSAPGVERLRGQIALASSHGRDAAPLLLKAAKRLESLDVGLARETYLEAL